MAFVFEGVLIRKNLPENVREKLVVDTYKKRDKRTGRVDLYRRVSYYDPAKRFNVPVGSKNGRWELHLHLPPSIMKGGGQPGRTTILRTVFLVLGHRQKIADRLNRTPYCADIYWPLARPTCSGG